MNNNVGRLFSLKVIVIGDHSTGKTSLVNAYLGNAFNPNVYSTYYADYFSKKVVIDGDTYNIKITDTPSGERYRNILRTYLRFTKIVILVFDMTKKRSFLELERLLDFILEVLESKANIVLVGNKSDLFDNFEIKEKEGIEFAKILNAPFYLASCKTNSNGLMEFLDNYFRKYITEHKDEFERLQQHIQPLNRNRRRRRNRNVC